MNRMSTLVPPAGIEPTCPKVHLVALQLSYGGVEILNCVKASIAYSIGGSFLVARLIKFCAPGGIQTHVQLFREACFRSLSYGS